MVNYTYNLTNLKNITSFNELITVANTSTDGILITLFIVAIFVVLFINFMRFDTLRAFAGSGFVCFVLSLFALSLSWVSILIVLIFGLMVAISGFLLFLEE